MTELASGLAITPSIVLVRQLGHGGMGTVWLADHRTLRSRVVVKFLSPRLAANAENRTRFAREASAAAQVKSPHVVQIFDHGVSEGGLPFIVMELLEGSDLSDTIRLQGRMPIREVAVVVAQVAKALQRAHDRGIVHRDIKPENIFLCDLGTSEIFAKLLDFGIAKADADVLDSLTKTGVTLGTPFYMSPEQMFAAAPSDYRVDLWALAVVAYEAITGQRPFAGESVAALALNLRKPIVHASSLVSDLPAGVDAFFAKAFASEIDQRFGSARDLANKLLEITATRMTSPPERTSMPGDAMPMPLARLAEEIKIETKALNPEAAPDSAPRSSTKLWQGGPPPQREMTKGYGEAPPPESPRPAAPQPSRPRVETIVDTPKLARQPPRPRQQSETMEIGTGEILVEEGPARRALSSGSVDVPLDLAASVAPPAIGPAATEPAHEDARGDVRASSDTAEVLAQLSEEGRKRRLAIAIGFAIVLVLALVLAIARC